MKPNHVSCLEQPAAIRLSPATMALSLTVRMVFAGLRGAWRLWIALTPNDESGLVRQTAHR